MNISVIVLSLNYHSVDDEFWNNSSTGVCLVLYSDFSKEGESQHKPVTKETYDRFEHSLTHCIEAQSTKTFQIYISKTNSKHK